MTVKLTPTESETIFHNALCNGLGYVEGYGIELDFNKKDYAQAAAVLKQGATDTVCYEDVLMQILKDGKKLLQTLLRAIFE